MPGCKFLSNGIAISYDGIVKPCCKWQVDSEWKSKNHYSMIETLENWHNSATLVEKRKQLENNIWPENCIRCKNDEAAGVASMRQNGESAYQNYNEKDVTLEIRPGNVCNFACQSCWPEASSRVTNFMHRAGLLNRQHIVSDAIDDFDFLNSIADRIRDVVVLGGEPFYDKHCKQFFEWAIRNLNANIMIFTNGLYIDYDFIEKYSANITLIFSLDAIEKPAEYIRYGSDWKIVLENYQKCKTFKQVEIRVNVTLSVYNFIYLSDLILFLADDWPGLVTMGYPSEKHLQPEVIPLHHRTNIIKNLKLLNKKIKNTNINEDQKCNVISMLKSIINRLSSDSEDKNARQYLCDYIKKMDTVKNINIQDYCPELYEILF